MMNNSEILYYYLDTEFNDKGDTLDLISIGIVSEDNKEFYRICNEFNLFECDDFVKTNVLPNLGKAPWLSKKEIASDLINFLELNSINKENKQIQFITYYGAYDYVILGSLFGKLVNLPKNINYFVLDIMQESFLNNIDISGLENSSPHNALEDAWWNKKAWKIVTRK